MTMRVVGAPELMGNGPHVVDEVPPPSRQRMGLPTHLIAGKPPAAPTPPPGSFFASIPPSSRAAMRLRADGVIPSLYRLVKGARDFFKRDELQSIGVQGLQGERVDEGASRAAPRTRKRGEQNNVSDEPTLHDVHEQLKRAAAAAARRASRKSTTVNGLTDVLSCEAFEELKAKNRAFRLRDAAENSDIALKQADYELKIVLAGHADFVARGGTMSQEMDDEELYAHHGRGEAAKDARTSWQLVQEALLVVEDCEKVVDISTSIVRKAEAACIVASRVAAHLQDKADRAGEALRVAQEGSEVAPLPVATRVGVAEEGGASSCDHDQEEPKAKRARR